MFYLVAPESGTQGREAGRPIRGTTPIYIVSTEAVRVRAMMRPVTARRSE